MDNLNFTAFCYRGLPPTVWRSLVQFCLFNSNFPNAMNRIISFLTNRTQVVKVTDLLSVPQPINTSIVQGSGDVPMLYVVMESDVRTTYLTLQ